MKQEPIDFKEEITDVTFAHLEKKSETGLFQTSEGFCQSAVKSEKEFADRPAGPVKVERDELEGAQLGAVLSEQRPHVAKEEKDEWKLAAVADGLKVLRPVAEEKKLAASPTSGDPFAKTRGADAPPAPAGEQQCCCSECGRSYKTKRYLRRHQLIHKGLKPFTCPDCGESFRLYVRLSQHRKLHLGERPHRCAACGKGFRLAKYLQQHESIHTGERPHRCPDCGKDFRLPSHLRSHQLIHTQDRPFRCWDCGASFRLQGEFQRHQQEHTGETPYQCAECGDKFRQQSSLTQHQKIHKAETQSYTVIKL